MIHPTFYTLPGDESFAPRVAHPGEDAGGDISAHVAGTYNVKEAQAFYSEYKRQPASAAVGTKGHMYVDGKKESLSDKEFLALLGEDGGVLLRPGATVLVNSGFKILFPDLEPLGAPWSYLVPCYSILPRSGLACKHNITVTNSPGLVDAGYQDWVRVSLTNNSKNYHVFTHGARIAQGVLGFAIDQSGSEVTTDETVFRKTQRSTGGFGSTAV